MRFDHEGLDAYKLALQVAHFIRTHRFPEGDYELKHQLRRSSQSVVLNLAEGRARGGKAAQNHYRIALGSAAETCAGLDLLPSTQHRRDMQALLRRIGSMLRRMAG